MKKYFLLTSLFLALHSFAQQKIENLNFESFDKELPTHWTTFGESSATITADSQIKQEGKTSVLFNATENSGFKALMYKLPENYAGKKITLSGYIKTENVSDGFAGLWLRIDPDVAFDNMKKTGLKGTNDWKKYEVTLNMSPENTDKIVLGALLVGKGKMWVDNLTVSIDGKEIKNAKVFQKKLTKVELDKEFDLGSKILNINLEKENVDYLTKLGLIWGYLKYYHPSVAECNYNWDYELFRIYGKTRNVSANQRDAILVQWIKDLGKYQTVKNTEPENVKFKPDLDWITNSGFSKELSQELSNLKNAKRPRENYYVDFFPSVGNPDFKNENAYRKMTYPDEGFRLLSLYRYWNMIQYYFPYKNLIEEDWKGVLKEFVPKFINAKDEKEYALASLEIIGRVKDSHANIINYNKKTYEFFGKRYPAFELNFVENKAVVDDFYNESLTKEAGIQIGDVITEINGIKTEDFVNSLLKYIPGSNYATQLRDVAGNLLRSNDETIKIKLIRNGKTEEKTIKTYTPTELNFKRDKKEFFKMLDNNTAYFYMGSVKADDLPAIFEKIKDTKGLVVDFRSYPSDFVVFKMGKLLKVDPSAFVKFTHTKNYQPGLFTFSSNLEVPGSGKNSYKGKIAILINETTQSSAEYHTMAFRTAPNAKVFGSQTAGADGNVSEFVLPGNIKTQISGIGIYYPDGKETQRIGIIPDEEVKPTIEGIKNSKDEVLEKATKWINN
ncbi:S41 family peptidase [Chryseobacterium formosus]|uniref:S41 family peptidase n=1 Tax=Chryseobacterium formosus TaxID=1537363 RepID=A0ABT3XVN6_9FLAO|nr:S41 family peptidase [Chryseobacterium formosus]MCX8525730.1 S41 family peptidase [Chryseobacterium formosus]